MIVAWLHVYVSVYVWLRLRNKTPLITNRSLFQSKLLFQYFLLRHIQYVHGWVKHLKRLLEENNFDKHHVDCLSLLRVAHTLKYTRSSMHIWRLFFARFYASLIVRAPVSFLRRLAAFDKCQNVQGSETCLVLFSHAHFAHGDRLITL